MRWMVCVLLVGCAVELPPKDDCEAASRMFAHCGVLLPVLTTPTCSGAAKAVAQCVVKTKGDCDALAALTSQIDVCAAEANNELPPISDVPLPGTEDGGVVDASSVDSGSIDAGPAADLATAPDLAPASTWSGFAFAETVDAGQQHTHQTPVLSPGTYVFSITGTGDADLYVRIGTPPTLSLYDCRPFLNGSDESCTITLTTTDRIYTLVRADAESSTYTLVGTQQ